MGTLRGDNGGERPPEGGGVPDLPPEWGLVVIPDDASELDDEATALRKEWRRAARVNRWRQRLGFAPVQLGRGRSGTPLALPLLIMSIAIVATLTSLFALVWPNHQVRRTPNAEASAAANAATLADLTLLDSSATPVRLRDNLPAVILLVDGCDCAGLISATASAAPAGVTVLAVAHAAPSLPGTAAGAGGTASGAPAGQGPATPDRQQSSPAAARARIRALADPAGLLLATFRGAGTVAGGAVAILVRKSGQILGAVAVTGVDQIRAELPRLV
jgi:hypothetical protein